MLHCSLVILLFAPLFCTPSPTHQLSPDLLQSPTFLNLIHKHGIPYNAPNISDIFDFLAQRLPLQERVQAQTPMALATLAQNSRIFWQTGIVQTTYEGVEHVTSVGNMFLQSKASLDNSAQQIEYLVQERHVLPVDFLSIAQAYRATSTSFDKVTFVPHANQLAKQYYLFNTLLYYPPLSSIQSSIQQHLNHNKTVLQPKPPSFWKDVEFKFNNGQVVIVDDLLSDWVLEFAYRFCLDATIYWEQKLTNTYVGSYSQFGLYNHMFVLITEAFRRVMPNIIGTSVLSNFWSYKYHNEQPMHQKGIAPHADLAKVNLNLWITPNHANVNKLTGGMIVYDDYRIDSVKEFQMLQDGRLKHYQDKIDQGKGGVHIPYQRNRMVLFDSSLVHQSSPMHFKKGYKNKRINLTWLFGQPAWKKEGWSNCQDFGKDHSYCTL